ncbi:MAG: hypothetical protein IPO78_17595 [Saprospiraceae bacterium]|nr:hypothetical protein [Saprospiraceae bacterium]
MLFDGSNAFELVSMANKTIKTTPFPKQGQCKIPYHTVKKMPFQTGIELYKVVSDI